MKNNIGKNERIVRVILGSVLMIGGFAVSGTVGIIMAVIGLIPFSTGLTGNCPAYSIFKISTCKTKNF